MRSSVISVGSTQAVVMRMKQSVEGEGLPAMVIMSGEPARMPGK